jgi:SAM-dependent methyltransferase
MKATATSPLMQLRRWMYRTAKQLYRRGSYLAAYRRDTDRRVETDPHAAVGGMWDVIGPLQFEYVRDHGLAPGHRMLDIGCGTLRGGRHFIRYLDPGRYTGFDLSPKAIEYARELVETEGLADKTPRLLVSKRPELRFEEFAGETFDVLLAQSVFTHLPEANIEECFAHVGKVMTPTSMFFFTFKERETGTPERRGFKEYYQPFSYFEALATRYGFEVAHMADYQHPRRQQMVRMTKR